MRKLLFLVLVLVLRVEAAEVVRVPLEGGREMAVHVHKPEGTGPFPVVLYLHGRGTNRAERDNQREPLPAAQLDWWLRRGVAVVAPVRPGYGGDAGAPDAEDTGARWRGAECVGEPDFARVARTVRDAGLGAHAWVLRQPWARKDRVLVVGHSLGGLGAVAVAAANPSGVRGVVNVSGATAGNPFDAPGRSCRPDLLAQVYGEFGRRARVPSVWVYAENDRFWGAEAPREWHAAYAKGGSRAELVVLPSAEGDGHLVGGEAVDTVVERFARGVGVLQ